MRVSYETVSMGVFFFALVVSLWWLDKGLFVVSDYAGQDGFFSQMQPFLEGVNFANLEPLQYVHFLRFLAVSPLVLGELFNLGSFYYAVVLFLFSLPILKIEEKGLYNIIKYVILLIPVVVSFRSFLVACAIAYLFIAIYHHKNYCLLFLSLLLSVLSSGVVLIWLLIFVINGRLLFLEYRFFSYGMIILLLAFFLPSVAHKMEYATDELGGFENYLLRGTLVVSFMEEQWGRFAVYMICVVASLSIAIRALLSSVYQSFYFSYAALLVGAMFEGLGLICGIIIIVMFFSGFRPCAFGVVYNGGSRR